MSSIIQAISYVLPDGSVTNQKIAVQHSDWPMEKIESKTGIHNRYKSATDEYSLELAIKAGNKLFQEHDICKSEIDFIIFCTQTPKYLIPTSACILQHALSIIATAGAVDINQGCSGYVYSLLLADSLIRSKMAKKILLITADTYTKLIADDNRSLVPIFGDAATASIISYPATTGFINNVFEFGTDGSGADMLIAKHSGVYGLKQQSSYEPDLYMDGAGIFNFTLDVIPDLIQKLLDKANLCQDDIDLFIFHQANIFMLEHLRKKIGICEEKFYVNIANYGNTVSSSIPIAIHNALKEHKIKKNAKIMLVGFGVGLSWAGTIINF